MQVQFEIDGRKARAILRIFKSSSSDRKSRIARAVFCLQISKCYQPTFTAKSKIKMNWKLFIFRVKECNMLRQTIFIHEVCNGDLLNDLF